ncbi:hypothetical protein TSAR_016728 [Trichomalopsis sarcophagae]|uniref:Uncharacterized protein n=1 Tax=Trichomalopsis sarcophagae TaxID=543379 RepID=A0A232EZC2_9HYME|nr:hypothetical protein TSAR_016728 [Trichomalopsis sarcophagae]
MWKQPAQEFGECFDSIDKCGQESTGDSGFLSNTNSASYTYSSELSSNSIVEDSQPVPVQSPKEMDSGIDFGLSDSFNQLSLKQMSLTAMDNNKVYLEPVLESTLVSIDSGRVSMTTSNGKAEEVCQEPWQLYYTQNDDGDTLLHTAIIQGYFEATLSLINIAPHSCLFDIVNDEAQTALHLAVLTKQPKIARRLVLAGADLSIRNHQGNTALHLACISGDLECAKALTEPIAAAEKNLLSKRLPVIPQNLEQQNYHGQSCLHIAAARGHVDLVRRLVHLGSDLEAQESLAGRTALHLALEHGQLELFLCLIQEYGPHLDAATYSGCTAYQLASCIDERLASELVSRGATPVHQEFREMPGFSVSVARA